MKLLLVEDEAVLSRIISKGLKKSGYAVDTAFDGKEALELFEINEYDLIILDLNLPKMDGIEVLEQIRVQNEDVKILILSARSAIHDKIMGLDCGANDYLIKPFDFQELDARIRNLLRRSFSQKSAIISFENITLDSSKKIVLVDGEMIHVTKKEYAILEYLMLHQNKVISSEELIEHVWDSETDLFSNSLKFHIHSLRKKIADVLEEIEVIQTIRGQGYIITENDRGSHE
ncbi:MULTISPECIES: response regulator transcription factor [Lysinibacillus]|uniref:response regulator transcription factor n=1 Tax=Lysinibacillus TaxID=400634 RepID=UPI0018CE2947|nr:MULTISPECIES: response regulator transcription factor [Lysinibacillus]MBG9692072.1 chemotaxis protein CheY [Lysinibacillus sphaericus]MBI6865493.1 response regulator transcription factor [Lysinibacillus fusiformis]